MKMFARFCRNFNRDAQDVVVVRAIDNDVNTTVLSSRTVPWLHPETMNVIAAAMSVKKCFIE